MFRALVMLAASFAASAAIAQVTVVPASSFPQRGTMSDADVVMCQPNGSGNFNRCTAKNFQDYTTRSVATFGAVGDGATDDAPAINAAIAAAQAAGGGVVNLLVGKTSAIAETLTIAGSNVRLQCPVNGHWGVNGSISTSNGCGLKWIGASAGTMLTAIAPSGSTSDEQISGISVVGLNFDGNGGLAANAILAESVMGGEFRDLYFQHFNAGLVFDLDVVHATSTTFGTNCDSQFNRLDNLQFNQYGYTSKALVFGAWVNTSYANNGCDASLNIVRNIDIEFTNATAITIYGDNNYLYTVRTYTNGSGIGLDFQIGDFGGYYPANGNVVFGYTSNAATYARGQATEAGCQFVDTCTFANAIFQLDKTNGTPDPTIEAGAQLFWRDNTGPTGPEIGGPLGLGDNYTDALACQSTVSTLCVANGSAAHIRLQDAANANAWLVNLDGTKLQLRNATGGGYLVEIPGLETQLEIYPGTGSGYQTGGGILANVGAPSGVGVAGDFFLRTDCTMAALTCLWHDESGTWVSMATGLASYLASPPSIGGTSPSPVKGTTVTATQGLITAPVTYASLPSSPVAGQRAAVSNTSTCTFMAAVNGSGSMFCPVVYTGAAWVAE